MARGRRLACLVSLILLALPAAAMAAGGLHVVPFPGTPDATPSTTIIFSSLRPADIASVSVIGSRSGEHRGRLSALPDGSGTAFIPVRPFASGDRVTVTAILRSPAAGTASGAPEASRLRFSFVVSGSAGDSKPLETPKAVAARSASTSPARTMRFHTQSFHPPAVTMSADPDTSSGDIFLTPKHAAHYHLLFDGGPMILDSRGDLVWFRPVHGTTTNLQVEHYQGQPVLTWWQTNAVGGRGQKHTAQGQDVIVSSSYEPVAVLHAGNGLNSDSHEFQITPQGTALIDCVHQVRTNLSSVGGPSSGKVDDYVIQELDIKTGRVLWEWHALGHIPLNAAYIPYRSTRAFDFFHLNSIQQLPNHNLLISARHTWGVYEIDKRTGRVLWTLGGKYSNFKIGRGANFEWQHDARLSGNTLSLFDDASNGSGQKEYESSAKVLRLNFAARTATLVQRYDHSPPLITPSQGSAQILPNGNVFVGWGGQPVFSEYRADGHQVFSGAFPYGAQSYRAYRFPWSAQPKTPPSLALQPEPGGSVAVYASWNGATTVAGWRVLGGPTPHALTPLGGRKRTGFETAMKLQSEPPYFRVEALGAHGTVLGTSTAHEDPPHVAIFGSNSFVTSGAGAGAVPVGCFTRQACHLTLRITSGKALLAQAMRPLARGTGGLVNFTLSPAGRRELNRSASHRLAVTVTVHDSSGASATRALTLIPYSVSGSGPARSTSQSPTIQIVQDTAFANTSTGAGQILAACYDSTPCEVTTTMSANGTQIASTAPERLGVDELGDLSFKLSQAGRVMLQHASGNQLPVQITLTDGSDTATGQIALVGYR